MTDRNNILLILTDQQRWDSLGCYGVSGVHTPTLDRLAARGIRYERCYVNATICTPSRACLWTGKHVLGHGVHALHDCLPDQELLFSHRLQDAGYETALFGKLHVSGHYREEERRHPNDGFDVYEWAGDPFGPWGMDNAYLDWLHGKDPALREAIRAEAPIGNIPAESHMTTWAAERTVDYITSRRGHAPFFCCMSVFDPHSPYVNYPKEAEAAVDAAKLPAVVGNQGFAGRPLAHAMEPRWNVPVPAAATLAAWRVGYYAAIAHIDAQVGRVIAALDETGLGESTTVIFTSDHGDMLGDHGLMTKGAYFYDACTRVPLIVHAPGVPSRVETAPAQLHDIASTCLGVGGQSATQTQEWSPDGVDLLDHDRLAARGRAVCLYRNSGVCHKPETGYHGYWDPPIHATMWFEHGRKVSIYHSPEADAEHPQGELYDLVEDPGELQNLWDAPEWHSRRADSVLRAMDWMALEQSTARTRGAEASGDRFSS